MQTYVHECPDHGRFEHRRRISETSQHAPCPECGQDSIKRPATPQVLIPAHFRTTLPVTGLKDGQGRSGEYENLAQDFRRWDSSTRGIQDKDARRAAVAAKQPILSMPR